MIEENIPYALYTASQNIDSSIEMQASVFSLHVKAFARKSIKKSFSSLLRKKNVFMIIFLQLAFSLLFLRHKSCSNDSRFCKLSFFLSQHFIYSMDTKQKKSFFNS